MTGFALHAALLGIACLGLLACGRGSKPASAPAGLEVLEWAPDPNLVPDQEMRQRLAALGLPWRVRHLVSGIELLLVPPGVFERGAADGDLEAAADESPRHSCTIPTPYYLGRYEVTQEEWQRVLGTTPSHFRGENNSPVEQVSMLAVREFLQKSGLHLPSEAQWEYACRAGSSAVRYGELDEIAWHRGNAGMRSQPVGQKRPNGLGFHDLLGNVWEWTASWYGEDWYKKCAADPKTPQDPLGGTHAVLRGGSWYDTALRARASARYRALWTFASGHVGLRVALPAALTPAPER